MTHIPMNIDTIMELVNAKCNDDARRAGVMTLGQLRDGLSVLPPDTPVYLDTGDEPHALSSYRGYYERLAIEPRFAIIPELALPPHTETALVDGGPGFDSEFFPGGRYDPANSEVTIAHPCTAAELIKALDIADGNEFEGYKGGQYLMDKHTFMHVASNGTTGPFVSALRVEADRVLIETKPEEF